jgi:hypothetical protein
LVALSALDIRCKPGLVAAVGEGRPNVTDPFDLYPVIAQIAAAFAGFGSLASGLGKHRGGDDARIDAYRLEQLLVASLSTTLFGLFPAAIAGLLDVGWALRLSAIIAGMSILILAPIAGMRAKKIRHVAGFSMRATIINSLCVWSAFVAFALCLADFRNRAAELYLVGLIGVLASSMMLFSRVIVSMLRPYHGDDG